MLFFGIVKRLAAPVHNFEAARKEINESERCMSREVITWVCGTCGAQLSGIGDWVEHACPDGRGKVPDCIPQRRRRNWSTYAPEVRGEPAVTKRLTTAAKTPAKTFEQLLSADDRAWMCDIEKAFSHS